MLTPFLNLELMRQNQIGKEIIFNNTILQLEQFASQMVLDFIEHPYDSMKPGMYIVLAETSPYHNHLVYVFSNKLKYFQAKEHMILFVNQENSFFKFFNNEWTQTHVGIKQDTELLSSELKYIGIKDQYYIPDGVNMLYLYIDDNVTIHLDPNLSSHRLIILIKQNYQKKMKVSWSSNVVFNMPELDRSKIILLELFKIPEEKKYFAYIK